MESFKEEHSDGKVFSMDIQKLKNYASKHKMKVALGTTMAAALIAGASAGTYAYFTSQATANTNLTLNKGTVELSKLDDKIKWAYLGNRMENPFAKGKSNYQGEKINPDLKDLNASAAIGSDPTDVYTGTNFENIVPGDSFVKKFDIEYTGSNEAEVAIKFDEKTTNWKGVLEYYNFEVDYSIGDAKPSKLIDNDTIATSYEALKSETGKTLAESVKKGKHIQLYVYIQLKNADYDVRAANNVVNFSSVDDSFVINVKNKLHEKTSVN